MPRGPASHLTAHGATDACSTGLEVAILSVAGVAVVAPILAFALLPDPRATTTELPLAPAVAPPARRSSRRSCADSTPARHRPAHGRDGRSAAPGARCRRRT